VLIYRGGAGVAKLTHNGEATSLSISTMRMALRTWSTKLGKYSGEGVIGSGPGFLQFHADGKWTVKVD
jgi:hypothetical protein